MAPHSSTLAWKILCRRSLVGCSPWGRWGSDTTEWLHFFHFHALEKEMATHSSVLAWRVPGTGEPDGLPPTGSHRVGHDWSDLAVAAMIWQVALAVKNPLTNGGEVRDLRSTLGSGRSPGGGHGNPPQCSCLENPMDRGAWWAAVHRVRHYLAWTYSVKTLLINSAVFVNPFKVEIQKSSL